MAIDGFAFESQFLAHLAPVWAALPETVRGMLLVDTSLVEHARTKGIDAEGLDAGRVRVSSTPPRAKPNDGPLAFVVSIGDMKIARRLGYRQFVFMEHGAGQAYNGTRGAFRHPSYAGGMDREDVGLFLVPNEYSAALWREAYPDAAVEVVGSPRLDDLPSRQPGPGPVVCISFHWDAKAAPEADTALGHYFTSLRRLADRFQVIGHAHPKGDWPARMERIYTRAGIEFVSDFDDVCRRADLYVCDNSTTIFEFAATGRPVVVLNQPAYRRNVNHGGRFWDWADVGVQVDEPADLIPAIDLALADGPVQRADREAALSLVYAFRTGGAQRAAQAIEAWVDERVGVAA